MKYGKEITKMQLEPDPPLFEQLKDGYVYFYFGAASASFKAQFPTLSVWQTWLTKHWSRLCGLRQSGQDDDQFKSMVFGEARMVFTKMLILKKCKEEENLKDIPQGRLVAFINHIFTLEDDILSIYDVDWDREEDIRWGEEVDFPRGYDSFSDLAVCYIREELATLQATVK